MRTRIAGVFYLLNIVTILTAIVCLRGIVVPRDPGATAVNLLARESLFRAGVGLEVISTACSIVVAAFLYEVLKPVDATVSLLAAFFRLTACGLALVGYVFQLAPLQFLRDSQFSAFDREQLATLAILQHRIHTPPSDLVIVFFGFHFMVLAWLILKSTFVPRPLGVVTALASVASLVFIVPSLARPFVPYFAAIGLLAELWLTGWLLTAKVTSVR